eukprot:g6644.t1
MMKDGNAMLRMMVRKATHVVPATFAWYLLMTRDVLSDEYIWIVKCCTALFFVLLVSDDARRKSSTIHAMYERTMWMKPEERTRLGASVYYFAGVMINLYLGLLMTQYRVFFVIGILNLGFGDPAAFLGGKLVPLISIHKRKTLGGFIACAATCAFITHNVLLTWSLTAPKTYEYHGSTIGLALLVGLTSAAVELRSGHDNLFIPVVSSLTMVVYDVLFAMAI